MSNHSRGSRGGGGGRRMSHASIDGDFSIADLGDLTRESSSGGGGGGGNHSYNGSGGVNHRSSDSAFQFDYAKEREEISQEHRWRNIRNLKVLTISILTLLALSVSLVVFFNVRRQEQSEFEESFWDGAQRISQTWERNWGLQIRAMDSLGIHVSSWAEGSRSAWPMVTVPDFPLRGQSALGFSGSLSVVLLPIVAREMRLLYEGYTRQNVDWVEPEGDRATVSPVITRREGDQLVVDTGEGPFFPAWTMSPIVTDVINFNMASDPTLSDAITDAYETQQIVVGKVHEKQGQQEDEQSNNFTIWQETIGGGDDETTIFSSMLVPVFQETELVALFSTSVIWSSLLQDSLSIEEEGHDYLAVMENGCGQVYSFAINGPNVTSSVAGDMHASEFNDLYLEYSSADLLKASKDFVTPGSLLTLNIEFCPYSLRIYPTAELEASYQSHNPAFYTLSIFLVFLLTAAVFGCYDRIMERRQQKVLHTAVEARAIVANLFPQQFRVRLFEQQRQQVSGRFKSFFHLGGGGRRRRGNRSNNPSEAEDDAHTEDGSPASSHEEEKAANDGGEGGVARTLQRSSRSGTMVSQSTLRLKTYLNESSSTGDGLAGGALQYDKTRPIADLFPNTTVLFADIVGFTSWCSQRDPENVFKLLESVFKVFDKLARRRGVFKVETIGDCYMAVTGLPDPQPDHAWCMAKFALNARTQMSEVLSDLETVLGPDTSELSCRFGMHSGSVTAGVLRGDKSRFQLFGDTVNTASRMESTGAPNRIQVSQATADCLVELGKGGWLRKRDTMIQPKGKGLVQTYWLASRSNEENKIRENDLRMPNRRNLLASAMASEEQVSTRMGLGAEFSDSDEEDEEGGQDMIINGHMSTLFEEQPVEKKLAMKKRSKVIMWQSELLIRALKLIVARRGQRSKTLADISKFTLDTAENGIALDEVVEAIELPALDVNAVVAAMDPDDVVLSPAILTQVHDYVAMLASMHTENLPYHNFERASSVAMSAMKLLNRILVPDVADVSTAIDLHVSTDGINSEPMIQFALVFAALVCSVDHPGVLNAQLAKEDPDLALLYRNKSIAEQKSFDIAWDLLMDSKYLDLRACIYTTEDELRRFRQLVVNCVIATDLFDPEMKAVRDKRWEKEFGDIAQDSQDLFSLGNRQATIIIEHIMQVSAVSHAMQHWRVYCKWNEALLHERMRAFQKGREEEDPSLHWYEQELGFFDRFVIPLAVRLQGLEVLGIANNEYMTYAMDNRREWEAQGEEMIKEMVHAFRDDSDSDIDSEKGDEMDETCSMDLDVALLEGPPPQVRDDAFDMSESITFEDLKF